MIIKLGRDGYLDVEEANVRMPHLCLSVRRLNSDSKEAIGQRKHAVKHRRQREVGPELLLLVLVLVLPQSLRPEGHVPQLQVALQALGAGELS